MLKAEDYQFIRTKIVFVNIATKTRIDEDGISIAEKKTKEPSDETRVEIIEFRQQGVLLGIPERVCAEGHQVNLSIEISLAEQRKKIDVVGKITMHQREAGGRDTVEVTFTQFEQTLWDEILSFFSTLQDNLAEFLEVAKGN